MATSLVVILLILLLSYLVGSIPPSYIVGKIFHGVDIRDQGSGNVGGANAIRLFGKKFGLAAGLFDILKGTAMVLIMESMSNETTIETGYFASQPNLMATAGFLTIVGHSFSLFLRFKGGKGGATTAGVVLALDPISGFILILLWILVIGTTRFTSLGNLLGIISVPVVLNYRTGISAYTTLGVVLIFLIYFTHRANISRLINGEERKFGQKEEIKKI